MYTPTTPCIYWTILVKACISGLFRFGYKGELERTLSTQKKISNNNKLYVESKIKAHKKGWTFYLCSWICFWFTNGNTPNQEFVMDFLRKLTFNLNWVSHNVVMIKECSWSNWKYFFKFYENTFRFSTLNRKYFFEFLLLIKRKVWVNRKWFSLILKLSFSIQFPSLSQLQVSLPPLSSHCQSSSISI